MYRPFPCLLQFTTSKQVTVVKRKQAISRIAPLPQWKKTKQNKTIVISLQLMTSNFTEKKTVCVRSMLK